MPLRHERHDFQFLFLSVFGQVYSYSTPRKERCKFSKLILLLKVSSRKSAYIYDSFAFTLLSNNDISNHKKESHFSKQLF